MKKICQKIFFVLLTAILMFGCARGPQARPQEKSDDNKIKVAVISASATSDHYSVFKKTMEDKGRQENLDLIWLDGKRNVLKQEENIEEAGKQKAQVIVLEPVNPDMLKEAIAKMQNQGVKFIIVGALPSDTPVEAYISPDYKRAGEIQAQQVLQNAKNGQIPGILILRGSAANPVAEDILQGTLDAFRLRVNMEQIRIKEIADGDTAYAYEQVLKHLEGPERPGMILTNFPEHTEGMLRAVKEGKGAGEDIMTFGMGTQKNAVEAIEAGTHMGEVDLMPELLAQIIVKAAKNLSSDEPWEYEMQIKNGSHDVPVRYTPIRSITAGNADLLKERMKEIEQAGKEAEQEQDAESSSQGNEESGSQDKASEGNKQKTVITIKTKDGQEFKMNINGEIVSVEMKGEEQEGQGEE